MSTTVEKEEIKRFAEESRHWWDTEGVYASLHKMNPLRIGYIKKVSGRHFRRNLFDKKPLKGLKILDVGCGGGLACEPLARLGADVTGLDADANAIRVASEHASMNSLKINYRNEAVEEHIKRKAAYDLVLGLEILEHVKDKDLFVKLCSRLCRPKGLVIVSTINRTAKSYVLGIVAAERILRWVPPGTHSWEKFIQPSELAQIGRHNNLLLKEVQGMIYKPLQNEFVMSSRDFDMNYFAVFEKPKD